MAKTNVYSRCIFLEKTTVSREVAVLLEHP